MVEFNPQLPDTGVPNMTGYSRGTGPDRSFESLFSGLTETAGNVLEIKDTATRMDIQDESRGMFDSLNQEFGLDAPAGIQDGTEQIQVLQNAFAQGKISEVNYYGRLATLSKQMRSKYPGYEDVVDATIQSVTGTRPANAFRDAIFNEISSLSKSASDSQKFRQQYEKENEGVIGLIFGPDYFSDPSSFDFSVVRQKVSEFKAESQQIEAERERLTLANSQGDFNDKRAKRALDRDLTFITTATLNRSIGANSPSFSETLNEFVAKGGGSGQELEGFINTLSQAEGELRAALLERGRTQYVAAGLVSNDDLNSAIDAAMYPLKMAKQAVLGGDFKLAGKFATISQTMKDEQVAGMMEDPEFRAGAGLDYINKNLGDIYFSERVDKISDLALEVAGRTALGKGKSIQSVIEHGNDKLSRKTIESSFKVLIDPQLQGQEFSNVMDQLFGPDAIDFMSPKVVAAEDLEKIYTSFLAPEVTRAIFQKGTDRDKQNYVDWAYNKALAIPAFRAAAGDINALTGSIGTISGGAQAGLTVEFDEKNLRVKVYNTGDTNPEGWKPYGRATNALNKALSVLKPIYDAQGVDGRGEVLKLLKNLSVEIDGENPEASNQRNSGFWGWMYSGVQQDPEGDQSSPTASLMAETSNQDSEIDFMFVADETDLEDGIGTPAGAVRAAGAGWTEIQQEDGTVVRRKGTRAWRNNNPGNIEYGRFARAQGAVGTDGRFAVFPTYEAGRAAKEALLFESAGYRDKTISQAISRYAPAFENNTKAYASTIAKAAGVDTSTKLSELTKAERKKLLAAMERVEGFRKGTETVIQ